MINIKYREASDDDIQKVVRLSFLWETEDITYGFLAGKENDYKNYSIWVCSDGDNIIGYLSGAFKYSEHMCVFPPNTKYFEVDELYIVAEWRSHGIGGNLYRFVENTLGEKGIKHILLSSATKDYKKVINFYSSLGFDMWTMVFHKKLTNN